MADELAGWAASLCLWLPLAVVLPACGAPGLPLGVRVSLAIGLAFAGPRLALGPEQNVAFVALRCLVTGGVAALGAAVVLSAALMVGGLADRLSRAGAATDAAGRGPLEALFGMTSVLLFLAGGGPTSLGGALLRLGGYQGGAGELARWVQDAALAAVTIAVVVAAPLLVTLLLFDVALALAARQSGPVAIDRLAPTLRALAFLVALALCFEGMIDALAKALG